MALSEEKRKTLAAKAVEQEVKRTEEREKTKGNKKKSTKLATFLAVLIGMAAFAGVVFFIYQGVNDKLNEMMKETTNEEYMVTSEETKEVSEVESLSSN